MEMRLRELGSAGLVSNIPTEDLRSTPLDKFTLGR
jgi:hypothetical protein